MKNDIAGELGRGKRETLAGSSMFPHWGPIAFVNAMEGRMRKSGSELAVTVVNSRFS